MVELFTVGYGRWPATARWQKLMTCLHNAEIQLLVDIRHSPCSSNLDPKHHYGPRSWHVQAGNQGIASGLRLERIDYHWLVELGNPQKRDPMMEVLREQLNNPHSGWPVHRGLQILRQLVVENHKRCCLLCACPDYNSCHRKLIAEHFRHTVLPVECLIKEIT